MWRRLAGWVLVAVLLGAAAYEVALALGAGTVGPEPGDNVTGAAWVSGIAVVAMLAGALLAPWIARRSPLAAALLAPSAAAFLVGFWFTYDPYFAPSLRRYSEGNVPAVWIALVAAAALAAGAVTYVRPRAGGVLTSAVLVLLVVTGLLAGDGH
jgi:dolichyl-phosphate-mannose--protein O-mannosyl transferase